MKIEWPRTEDLKPQPRPRRAPLTWTQAVYMAIAGGVVVWGVIAVGRMIP